MKRNSYVTIVLQAVVAMVFTHALSMGATFTVTSTGDANTPGTLRWALSQSNSSFGADTVTFDISGTAPHTITIPTTSSNLPSSFSGGSLFVDGDSQPANGYTGMDPKIIVDGQDSASNFLSAFGPGTLHINGIKITRFSYGVRALGLDTCYVSNCNIDSCSYAVTANSGPASIRNSKIGDCSWGVTSTTSGGARVAGCDIRNCTAGVLASGGVSKVLETRIAGCSRGIQWTSLDSAISARNEIVDCGTGVLVSNSGFAEMKHDFIELCGTGVSVTGTSPQVRILNSRVTHCTARGISCLAQGGKTEILEDTISWNDGIGILASSNSEVHIRRNQIECNAGKGISWLAGNPPPPPTLSSSNSAAAIGTTSPNALIEVFENDSCSCSGQGQGKVYLGSTYADSSGNWTFSGLLPPVITTTATDTNTCTTSEFSVVTCLVLAYSEPDFHPEPGTDSHTGFTISPNPSVDDCQLVWKGELPTLPIRGQIIDIQGKVLADISEAAVSGAAALNVKTFPPGIYWILIKEASGTRYLTRFVKQ